MRKGTEGRDVGVCVLWGEEGWDKGLARQRALKCPWTVYPGRDGGQRRF